MKEIEDLTAAEMSYTLDKSVVNYYRERGGDISTLRNILRRKQRFPKDLFLGLKKAFPCILAGVRDYSEFIPLEKDLFDLVIIDEASQVSIAQSLPALIRGRQLVVLGDDKQFSNVKANNASKSINSEFKDRVRNSFCEEKTDVDVVNNGWLTKVEENFDIKNSILKFSRFIRNYECQLRKHFRCYPEIISYSDKYFYDYSLQCMKVRGKNIEDVLKFKILEHDGLIDQNKNTNEMEADYIIKELKKFKEKGFNQSIGIITPHREQVNIIFDKISNIMERDWLFDKCKLKIMTFDTCQGEERDYIFYSMVATKEKDQLKWIFLKSFSSLNTDENETIRAQRLNVGFSRAKECMHFVLSKKIEKFNGEIKNALMHYYNEIETAKQRKVIKLESPMEYKIEDIFYKTSFYKKNKKNIEFIPQFEIGKYLKQIYRNYHHPNYRVDFLLIYGEQKIIIEYDGFKEHFTINDNVDENNYNYYIKEDDIYRQKILEGYGYKFLRINKFNIGKDPIEILNERIEKIIQNNNEKNYLEEIHRTIDDIEKKKKRQCSCCGKLKESFYFRSDITKRGYSRICIACRNLSSEERKELKKVYDFSDAQKLEEKIIDEYEKSEWSVFANNSNNWDILLNSESIDNEDRVFLKKIITKLNLRMDDLTNDENKKLKDILLKIKK
jgi:very-short-patch-repair endonuclease